MEYVVISILKHDRNVYYRVINQETYDIHDVPLSSIFKIESKLTNAKLNIKRNRVITRNTYKTKFILGEIGDSGVIKDTVSILGIKGDLVVICNAMGVVSDISIKDYIEYRQKSRINNESIIVKDDIDYLDVKQYGLLDVDPIALDKKEVIEVVIDDRFDYKSIIHSMYPMDRITISKSDFSEFSGAIVRVLESNMSGSKKITLNKIRTGDNRDEFTLALVKEDNSTDLIEIQVLAQSDNPDKSLGMDIDGYITNYVKWLDKMKYVTI